MTEPLEIERKFLIEMPERAVLDRCPTRWEIWQTYLLAPPGISARVRRRVGETEQFFHTEKLVKLLDDHKNGKADNSRRVWTVYTFLVWYDQFFNDDILNGYAEHTNAKTA